MVLASGPIPMAPQTADTPLQIHIAIVQRDMSETIPGQLLAT